MQLIYAGALVVALAVTGAFIAVGIINGKKFVLGVLGTAFFLGFWGAALWGGLRLLKVLL